MKEKTTGRFSFMDRPGFHAAVAGFTLGTVAFFRHIALRECFTRYGTGFLSLSAPTLNGFAPHWFARVMHNLTTLPVLIPYAAFAVCIPFVVARAGMTRSKQNVTLELVTLLNLAFGLCFMISCDLPVGDMVEVIAK
jgi:hypothetical protein